jgi:hypothetical protein
MSLRGLPVADAPALARPARRASLVRTALLVALAALLGAAIVLADRSKATAGPPALSGNGSTTEVVLDVSGSVGDGTYGFTARTLERLSRSRERIGLVVFSDSAEEALPPGSPSRELRPVARLFRPLPHPMPFPYPPLLARFPLSPWYASFSAGTRISAGLAAARGALTRDHVHGRILLISDLGDAPEDAKRLRTELVRLAQAGISLRVLPLPTSFKRDIRRFRRLEGPHVAEITLPPPSPRPATRQRQSAALPTALAAVAVLIALALAANELYGVSLRWKEPT